MSMTSTEREQRIHQYERGPLRLHDALHLVPDEAVKWPPAPGQGSAHENLTSRRGGGARPRRRESRRSLSLPGSSAPAAVTATYARRGTPLAREPPPGTLVTPPIPSNPWRRLRGVVAVHASALAALA